MKARKSEITNILDDLRNQDPKKREQSVLMIKAVAEAIGPVRTRTQFIPFLNEFADDQEQIILSLLDQLVDFTPCLGGQEHEKCIIPLLISFCKLDQRLQAEKSVALMIPILTRNPDIIVDTIKKIGKADMVISKECAAQLIASLVRIAPSSQNTLLEIYTQIVNSEYAAIRKVGARHLNNLLSNVKTKEQIGKMLESICNDVDDLPKLLAMDALINYYDVDSNFAMNKLKNLLAIQSWRINLKICELINQIVSKFSKPHFKSVVQPYYHKFFTSSEPEVRAAAIGGLSHFSKNLSQDEIKTKLIPCLKAITQDETNFVKISLASNILNVSAFLSKEQTKEHVIPIAMEFMKAADLELSIAVMSNFNILSAYISEETFEEHILKKITYHFNSDNWRLKCQAVDMISKVIENPSFISQKTISMIMELASDKVDAVRKKIVDLIVEIIKKQSKDWSDANVISQLIKMKENRSYLHRQTVIPIIQKTIGKVSDKTLNSVYRPIICALINDRIPNIRVLALNVVKENPSIVDSSIQESINLLKDDKDIEVKTMLKSTGK